MAKKEKMKEPKHELKDHSVLQLKEKFKNKELTPEEMTVELVSRLGEGPDLIKEMIELSRPSSPTIPLGAKTVGNQRIKIVGSKQGVIDVKVMKGGIG